MRKLAMLFLGVFWVVPPAMAGAVYTMDVVNHLQQGEAMTNLVSVEGENLSMDMASETARNSMIFRGDRREMIMIDHQKETFMVMDEETLKAMAGQLGAAMSQMEEALKNVPEGQRAMMEKMLKERMPGMQTSAPPVPIEVRSTGETASHSGYSTQELELYRGDVHLMEMWVTNWSAVEASEEYRKAFLGMAQFAEELLSQLPQQFMDRMPFQGFAETMTKVDGFPIVTRRFQNGNLAEETTFRSVEKKTIDPSAFEPPKGYKRQQMPSMQ